MRRAVEAFEQDFARWGLCFPADAVEAHRGGQIREAGWSIRYNFGQDAHGEYIDYYASPRDVLIDPPGDDWHVRLYASGERAVLPTVLEAYMYGRDPTWEELERTRRQFAERMVAQETSVPPSPQPASPDGAVAVGAATGVAQPTARPAPGTAPQPPAPPRRSGAEAIPRNSAELQSPEETEPSSADYLPLDIGLDVEFDLGEPVESATEGKTEEDALEPSSASDEADWVDVETEDGAGPMDVPGGTEAPEPATAESSAVPIKDALSLDAEAAPITLESSDDWAFGAPNGADDSTAAPGAGAEDGAAPEAPTDTPSPLDEVNRGGLVLFYPTPDDAAAEGTVDVPIADEIPASTSDVSTVPSDAPPLGLPIAADSPGHLATPRAAPDEPHDMPPAHSSLAPAEPADNNAVDEMAQPISSTAHVHEELPVHAHEPPNAPLTAPVAPLQPHRKVFARADLVLTADVAAIEGQTNPEIFMPWWYRPTARRIVLTVAGVVLAILLASTLMRHRTRPSGDRARSDVADSSESTGVPGSGSAAADSANAPDPSSESRPGVTTGPDSAAPALEAVPESAPATPPATSPAPEAAGRASDDAVAHPVGPGSIPPIVPSRSGAARPGTAGDH